MNLIFIGLPRCGKTTVGKEIAARLNFCFVDLDLELEKRYNQNLSCPEIFKKEGEKNFRTLELETLHFLKDQKKTVLALGGGALESLQTRSFLKNFGLFIYLKLSYPAFLKRVNNNLPESLKELNDTELKNRCINREKNYEALAHYTFDGEEKHLFEKILEAIKYGQ